MRRSRKRHLKMVGIAAAIFVIAAGSLWYFLDTRTDGAGIHPNGMGTDDKTARDRDGIVTAAGLTEIGMDTVIFPVDFPESVTLCVEDVYLLPDDTVAPGEKCIKFTEDSIDKARAELEKAVRSAELDYRSKVVSNRENSMQAKYTYDMAALEAKYAPQVYQDTLAQLETQFAKAEKAYNEAQEEYDAYYLAVENNTFYEDYQIETLKKAYDDAYDLFASRREYWEVTEEELSALSASGADVRGGQSDRQWIVRTVALLREEMEETKKEYEQARRSYQTEIEGAGLKLQILLNQLERAEQSYTEAQIGREKGSLHAKTSYELTVAKGQTAENDYNGCLMRLANELEQTRDAMDKAVEDKALFERLVRDGYLYTERAGTIAMVRAEKGQELTGGDRLFAYGSPGEMSVSAAVPKEDTAELSVGDRARVTIAECGSFDGIIEAIQPMASSDPGTSACNVVRVFMGGDISVIQPNLPAMVVFGEDTQRDGDRDNGTGALSQMYDLDIYDRNGTVETDDKRASYLKVEEVYAEAGQEIKEGDPVCRFTQDSIQSVRKTLAYAQSEAQIALAKAQTGYHMGVLEAGLSHNESMLDRSLAQTVYDNTIARWNSDMAAKALGIEQILAEIYQLQLSLTDDAYLEQKADITKAYDKARKQVEDVREDFVTSRIEAVQAFQEAEKSYKAFFDQFERSNQQIADKVEQVYAIQDEIQRDQQFWEKELMAAEQARSSSQIAGEIANAKYADSVKEYETALEQAQEEFDRATGKLDDFDRFVGDGTIYAPQNGLVTKVGCKEGDLLADMGSLVFFVEDTGGTVSDVGKEEEGTQ